MIARFSSCFKLTFVHQYTIVGSRGCVFVNGSLTQDTRYVAQTST
jgi:hypothetical protein